MIARRPAGRVVRLLLVMLIILAPRMPTAQVEELVDLSIPDREHRLGSVPTGERMIIPPVAVQSHSSTAAPSVPFKLTLASLNTTSLTPSGSFVYEVVLENVS